MKWSPTAATGRKFELGFTYVPSVDRYRCPKGKWLYRLDVPYNGLIRYRTHRYACRQCELKPSCTRGEQCTISQPVDGGNKAMGRRPSQDLEGQAQHPSATVLGRDGHG